MWRAFLSHMLILTNYTSNFDAPRKYLQQWITYLRGVLIIYHDILNELSTNVGLFFLLKKNWSQLWH
jgi:hypothetical protein